MSAALREKLEDVYPLTPFQQGVLFHVLDRPNAGMYLNQQRYTLRGELDVETFKQALEGVVSRHQILRTAFILSGLDGPHQIVYRHVKLPWSMHDWSELPATERSARLEEFLLADYECGFDLKRVPLSRMTLLRLEPDLYEFIWSFHLLVMDGWSMQVMLKDLLTLYHLIRTGQPAKLDPPLRYQEFIKWQQRQPQADAEAYWRTTLTGFTSPTPLVFDRTPADAATERPNFKEKRLLFDEPTSNSIRTFGLQHRLTLNTLLLGAWAILLSRRSGTDDIVFGNAVSGRSAATIPKIDHAVGLYVNVLPVRVHVDPNARVVDWLTTFQKQQAESRRFEFCSLASIHRWSEVPRSQPLFESVVIFQNYPGGVAVPKSAGVELIDVDVVERSNLPLALVPHPGREFLFKVTYMGSWFDDATIDRMLDNFKQIFIQLTTNPDATLSSISYKSKTEQQLLIDSFNQNLASL